MTFRRALAAIGVGLFADCTPPPPADGLPCDVADVVSTRCLPCHGAPLAGGAPMSLRTRDDFLAASSLYPMQTIAERCVARMKDTSAPMPPASTTVMTDNERTTLEHWVSDSEPAGTCTTRLDAGLPDAGTTDAGIELTCLSGQLAPQPSITNTRASPLMAPGDACAACHVGQNFHGQNPGGALGQRPDLVFSVMGTVYTASHEKDLCLSSAGDAGVVVKITDKDGVLVLQVPVNAAGNFYANADGGLKTPYTVKLVAGTATRVMMAAQTMGDCNQCHTAVGDQSAPGRILAP